MKFALSVILLVVTSCGVATAQIMRTESARKAGQKLSQGDTQGAIAVLTKAIEKGKDLEDAYRMRADIRSISGDIAGAVADFTTAIQLSPNDAILYERRGTWRSFLRDHDGALKDFDAAVTLGLKSEKAFIGRARIKQDSGRLDEAIGDYRVALGIDPDLPAAHNGLAGIFERQGNIDGAIAQLKDFLDRFEQAGKVPKGSRAKLVGSPTVLTRPGDEKESSNETIVGLSGSMTIAGDSPQDLEKAKDKHERMIGTSQAYISLGRFYLRNESLDRSLDCLSKGLRMNPNAPSAHQLRSEVRVRMGDGKGAIDDLKRSIASPFSINRSSDKAVLLTLEGNDAEAEKEIAQYLAQFPKGDAYLSRRIKDAKILRSKR